LKRRWDMITSFRTTVHGRTIELPWDLGLPEDRIIEVTIKTCPDVESPPEPPLPRWLERLEVDASGAPGRFVLKGTQLRAEALVELLEAGKSEEELLAAHPELTPEDVAAVREYAKLPLSFRRSSAYSAEEAEELDKFVEETYRRRRASGREIEE
jgi:uncharacterized protein (DUF433 family)